MNIRVQKFGGTSLGSPERIRHVARLIKNSKEETKDAFVVVVSAMGHTTDELINLAKQVSSVRNSREMDMLLATGEQVSIALLTMALHELGLKAISLTGFQAKIKAEQVYSKARILEIETEKIKDYLKNDYIVIVAGFQGITENTEIVTLGRGGSDTTAVALASALNAKVCDIYTDVDGVYTADPRVVPNARKLKEISYDEMLELASLGAQVLHPRAVECASYYDTIIHVRSSFKNEIGTFVKGVNELEVKNSVSGVALDKNQVKIALLEVPDIPGMAGKLFTSIADKGYAVDMIIQSVHGKETNDIAFTVSRDDFEEVEKIAKQVALEIGAKGVIIDENVAKVSIVGAGMVGRPGVAATMFNVLGEAGINIQMISTSEIKISCIVDLEKSELATRVIHEAFIEEKSLQAV
ncbi:MAG: aspartokinase [Candidatus Sericytochromatia bacterium]|nr:MAG: aspartokinase [Candidatus Sericytochromatia bacterium]